MGRLRLHSSHPLFKLRTSIINVAFVGIVLSIVATATVSWWYTPQRHKWIAEIFLMGSSAAFSIADLHYTNNNYPQLGFMIVDAIFAAVSVMLYIVQLIGSNRLFRNVSHGYANLLCLILGILHLVCFGKELHAKLKSSWLRELTFVCSECEGRFKAPTVKRPQWARVGSGRGKRDIDMEVGERENDHLSYRDYEDHDAADIIPTLIERGLDGSSKKGKDQSKDDGRDSDEGFLVVSQREVGA